MSIIKLTHLTPIAVNGDKARDFLQGQLTCDIRDITPTQIRLTAHCSPKGRVLSSFHVIQFLDTLYLIAPDIMQHAIIQQLKKYAVFSRVTLQPTEQRILGCVGETAVAALRQLIGTLPEQPDQAMTHEALLIIRMHGEQPRYVIFGAPAAIAILQTATLQTATLQQALAANDLMDDLQDTSEHWRLLDIQAGMATIYPETSDLFTPQMLNYPALNAVSFSKGCYTGQEVIARTHYLGKAKRHLQYLISSATVLPKPGESLFDAQQQPIGTIIDAAQDAQGKCHVLAVVQRTSS